MNKHIFPVMVAGLLAMASCNKETAVKAPAGQKQAHPATTRMSGAIYSFNDAGECVDDGANCFASGPVIIHGPARVALTEAEAGGKRKVGQVFNSQVLREVCAAMAPDLRVMLQSGDYYIRKNYESAGVINYMIGTEYPVTPQNMTVAFQLNK